MTMKAVSNNFPSQLDPVLLTRHTRLPPADLTSRPDVSPTSPTETLSPSHCSPRVTERVNVRLASAYVMFFVLGWGDGVTGTLLPYFKTAFHLSFMTSSLCFVASALGFGLGTMLVERLLNIAGCICLRSKKLTFSKNTRYSPSLARFTVVFGGTLLHPIFFIIMGLRMNFPSMLTAYVISAFARSLLSATMNYYCTSVNKRALGYMYGYWSIGSMCAPLVCQSIIAKGVAWNHFYFGSLVLSVTSALLAFYAFKPTSRELVDDKGIFPVTPTNRLIKEGKSAQVVDEANLAEINGRLLSVQCNRALGRALKMPIVWAFAIFSGLYTGTEASTQGFIVTYLLNARNANPNTVGYTTSGFWGGLALGRFLWGYFNTRLTFERRKHVIHACIGLALSMHLLILLIKSFVANTLCVAIVGLAYASIFPGNMGQANEVFPDDIRMIGMALMGTLGSLGAALFPFITGTVSNYKGPQSFVYIVIAETASLLCMWSFLPSSAPENPVV